MNAKALHTIGQPHFRPDQDDLAVVEYHTRHSKYSYYQIRRIKHTGNCKARSYGERAFPHRPQYLDSQDDQ